jgi:hypothetical protein
VAAFCDKNIGGLDIPVNDPLPVGCVECIGNLDRQRENRLDFHRTPSDPVLQSHAVQKLHHDKRHVVFLPNLMNGADIGMVQSRSSLSLALKSRQSLRVFGDFIWEELEGDKPVQV